MTFPFFIEFIFMKISLFIVPIMSLSSSLIFAQSSDSSSLAVHFEFSPLNPTPIEQFKPLNTSTTHSTTKQLNEQDLLQNKILTEHILQTALVKKQWDLVIQILDIYKQIPDHDQPLYQYATAGYLRNQNKHTQSLAYYERMLQDNPELHYVRMDYMIVLFENKQLKQALEQINILKTKNLHQSYQDLLIAYESAILKAKKIKFNVNMNYENTDNVNNASNIEYIQLGGLQFKRNQESLPQKASGISYDISISKLDNIKGNHFLSTRLSLDGTYYFDNHDYNEETLTLDTAYQYRNIRHYFKLQPFFDYTRFNQTSYRHQLGIISDYSYSFLPNWQSSFSTYYSQQFYTSEQVAKLYDGHSIGTSITQFWFPTQHQAVFLGADVHHRHTKSLDERSIRHGLRLGTQSEWQNIAGRLDLRYGIREFKYPHFFFKHITRQDDELQLQTTVWLPKFHWHGYNPALNYQYSKIESNIPVLYNRNNQRWFISIDKNF